MGRSVDYFGVSVDFTVFRHFCGKPLKTVGILYTVVGLPMSHLHKPLKLAKSASWHGSCMETTERAMSATLAVVSDNIVVGDKNETKG